MTTVTIKDAKNRLTELARRVEEGETVVVTRHGKPVFDLVPHQERRGLDPARGRTYLERSGVTFTRSAIAADFDAPLPEDILLAPMPE